MKDILVVVDMQKDFIDGSLGTNEAEGIVSSVVALAKNFPGDVLFTRDTHSTEYLSTAEGKKLPVEHCIQGTAGWELHPELGKIRKERDLPVFDKGTFGSKELAFYLRDQQETTEGISSITLCGLCTDICVISNALLFKAFMPEVPIRIQASCCAGVTPESHKNALEAMSMCQIEIIS
ncbi:MAG: cysteine hydrolase [Lachnospiraceae bacterium]|jgi:nicotinamidase/pyrazinamidase|nr:cysteine hydrolase [Lachnospiraceae bacterium]